MNRKFPHCFGTFGPGLEVCRVCYARVQCQDRTTRPRRDRQQVVQAGVWEGEITGPDFELGHTLGSGQVFRWGRDADGWWKGIAYGTAFHLRQKGDRIAFKASAEGVKTYAGEMGVRDFLVWYLRTDEAPRVRVPRQDRHLRKARGLLRGLRFVRQDPFECMISYILSVQAHMNLTKRRINFLARILGEGILFLGERYWTFPRPEALSDLNGDYYRRHKFGWRSERVAMAARYMAEQLEDMDRSWDLGVWQEVGQGLYELSGSGVGLKVAKCIDLFSLDRLDAVPVDTWVRKMAKDWYGVTGSDAKICAWAEERGGKWAGYMNEYLFAYYRELNGQTIYDQVLSFCETEIPSAELPFETSG
ncbi:MAG: DNA glycosylase [bacterium]|nr:DNA glycosylase [bacterium]